VRELDIDLIDRINPFGEAYAILAKTMSEESLKQLAAAIAAKRTSPRRGKQTNSPSGRQIKKGTDGARGSARPMPGKSEWPKAQPPLSASRTSAAMSDLDLNELRAELDALAQPEKKGGRSPLEERIIAQVRDQGTTFLFFREAVVGSYSKSISITSSITRSRGYGGGTVLIHGRRRPAGHKIASTRRGRSI
jgi:hypothetical protein